MDVLTIEVSFQLDGVTLEDGRRGFDSLATGGEEWQTCLKYQLQVQQDKNV